MAIKGSNAGLSNWPYSTSLNVGFRVVLWVFVGKDSIGGSKFLYLDVLW